MVGARACVCDCWRGRETQSSVGAGVLLVVGLKMSHALVLSTGDLPVSLAPAAVPLDAGPQEERIVRAIGAKLFLTAPPDVVKHAATHSIALTRGQLHDVRQSEVLVTGPATAVSKGFHGIPEAAVNSPFLFKCVDLLQHDDRAAVGPTQLVLMSWSLT